MTHITKRWFCYGLQSKTHAGRYFPWGDSFSLFHLNKESLCHTQTETPRKRLTCTPKDSVVNRIRQVRPRKGQPFWSVEINCLHGGMANRPVLIAKWWDKRPLLFEKHLAEVGENDKVMASVVISDIYLHQFIISVT